MNEFYNACVNSPSGLLIQIWGMIYPFALTNQFGGKGITIMGDKSYSFGSVDSLNKYDYSIINGDGIKFGKISDYSDHSGYVVVDGVIVCGVHANGSVATYDGCKPSELVQMYAN